MHELEGQHQQVWIRQVPDLGPLSQVAAIVLGDPNDMEQVLGNGFVNQVGALCNVKNRV